VAEVSERCQNELTKIAENDKPEKECDHQGHYRLVNGLHVAIRMCVQCGKSWRMPTQGDYIFGDHPVAEWEPIKEGLEVEERILPDYEE
jgi:hypothetical protein